MSRDPSQRRIPFGHNKGERMADVTDDELRRLRSWCQERNEEGNFDDLIADIEQVIEDRQGLPLGIDEKMRERGRE